MYEGYIFVKKMTIPLKYIKGITTFISNMNIYTYMYFQ